MLKSKFAVTAGAAALSAMVLASSALIQPAVARAPYAYFLFFPCKELHSDPAEINGIAKENVEIRSGKSTLSGWYFKNPASPYVVLVSHGNGGNISSLRWIVSNLLSANASVLVYDYRGYGGSKGKAPTAQSICADGDAAYDFLRTEKGYQERQIILYGQSLGCAVACHTASTHQVAGMILQSGFSSLRTVAYQHFRMLKHLPRLLVPKLLDNVQILSHTKTPVLLIHGDKDKIVPFSNANQLYEAAAGEKRLVVCHDSGHRLYPEADEQHRAAVTEFIDGIAKQQAASSLAASEEAKPQ